MAILLIVYAYNHQKSDLVLVLGRPDVLALETFFYTSLAIFMVTNALFYMFFKMSETIQPSADKLLFFKNIQSKRVFMLWQESFVLATNVAFICIVAYLGFINSPVEYNLLAMAPIIYLAPLVVLVSVLSLIVLSLRLPGQK